MLHTDQTLQAIHPSKIPSQRGSLVIQGCHVLPFVQLRYSNLYLDGRNPAAGEKRAGKSLSIQLRKHKFKSPDHMKTFCSQISVYSWVPRLRLR